MVSYNGIVTDGFGADDGDERRLSAINFAPYKARASWSPHSTRPGRSDEPERRIVDRHDG
jgi:hypothetical protein